MSRPVNSGRQTATAITSRRRSAVAALGILAAALLPLTHSSPAAAAPTRPPGIAGHNISWPSTGDSFSSGEGITGAGATGNGCAQSELAFGPRARKLLIDQRGWQIGIHPFSACTGHLVGDFYNEHRAAPAPPSSARAACGSGRRSRPRSSARSTSPRSASAALTSASPTPSPAASTCPRASGPSSPALTAARSPSRSSRRASTSSSRATRPSRPPGSTGRTTPTRASPSSTARSPPSGSTPAASSSSSATRGCWPRRRAGRTGGAVCASGSTAATPTCSTAPPSTSTPSSRPPPRRPVRTCPTVAASATSPASSSSTPTAGTACAPQPARGGSTASAPALAPAAAPASGCSTASTRTSGHQGTAELVADAVEAALTASHAPPPPPAPAATNPVVTQPRTTAPTTSPSPLSDTAPRYEVGSPFDFSCVNAWPTAPTYTTTSILLTMHCPRVSGQFLFVQVQYGDPNFPINPSTEEVRVPGRIVDVARSAYGYSELVVVADRVQLVN